MIRVRVGAVEVRTDADLTVKQMRSLLREAAGIALAFGSSQLPADSTPLGFTAHLERLPDELPDSPA